MNWRGVNGARVGSGVTTRGGVVNADSAAGMAPGSNLVAMSTAFACSGDPGTSNFSEPVYMASSGGMPLGTVPSTESSWLPKTQYQGVFRPGLVTGAIAAPSRPGISGNPAFLYMSWTEDSGFQYRSAPEFCTPS